MSPEPRSPAGGEVPTPGAPEVTSHSRVWACRHVTGAVAIRILPPDPGARVENLLGKNLSLAAWVRPGAARAEGSRQRPRLDPV
jgi:hypothetical protein